MDVSLFTNVFRGVMWLVGIGGALQGHSGTVVIQALGRRERQGKSSEENNNINSY